MIGIKFEIPNEYNVFLGKILENIAPKDGVWRIVCDEVLNEKGNDFFTKEIYSNSEFKELISKETHYSIFLTLQLYEKNDKMSEIKNYNDYLNSDCKLLLIIVDNIFVDIYSKDESILRQIKRNAENNKFSNIVSTSSKEEFHLYY